MNKIFIYRDVVINIDNFAYACIDPDNNNFYIVNFIGDSWVKFNVKTDRDFINKFIEFLQENQNPIMKVEK